MRRWITLAALFWLATVVPSVAQVWPGTLLYQGGELSDFVCFGGTAGCIFRTSANGFRPGWARGAVQVAGDASNDPPIPRLELDNSFAGQTTLWVHGQYCSFRVSVCTTLITANSHVLGVYDNLGNPSIVVSATGVIEQVKIESRSAGGGYTTLVTCPSGQFPLNSLAQMDLEIIYSTTVGEIHLFSNGNDICDFTGNTTNGDGATTLTGVYFSSASAATGAGLWSEILIGTADTRALERKSAYVTGDPVAPGVANWLPSGGCGSILPADTLNDSLYVYTATSNAIEECSINGSIPAGLYESVVGLGVSSRTLISPGSGPQHFSWITNISGTDNAFGASQAPNAAFNNGFNVIQTTNPATGLPWAIADFASPFSLGQKALP